jgi:hypothetical protein
MSKFVFDTIAFANSVEEKLKQISPILAEVMGNAQVANNQLRLDNGIGVDDKKMKLYSRQYALEREARGERIDVRNLVQTGRMRGGMALQKVERTSTGAVATIGFTDARARELAFYNQQRTPFFGISPSDATSLDAVGQAEAKRLLEGG